MQADAQRQLYMSSESEGEGEMPEDCIRRVGGPPAVHRERPFDPARHLLMDASSCSEDEASTPMPQQSRDLSACSSTGRGKHTNRGHKLAHADQARKFKHAVTSTALSGACESGCTFGCEGRVLRNEMLECIEESYGAVEWVSAAQIKQNGRQNSVAYGKEQTADDGCVGRWTATVKAHASGDCWAGLFDSFVTFNSSGQPLVSYSVGSKQTCGSFARHAYGIPESTWLQGLADAKKQPGGAVIARRQRFVGHATKGLDQLEGITSTSEAIGWWKDLMLEWDKLPNESPPVIKHPAYVAEALYKEIYLAEMEMDSMVPPLRQKDGKAPGSWLRARNAALVQFSLDECAHAAPDAAPPWRP